MSSISVVMVTLNESRLLAESLRSVRELADQILVADMGSTDGSPEIAAAHGAEVVAIEPAPAVEVVRPGLVARAAGDWVLLLDPDEVIAPELSATLRRVAEGEEHDAVEVVMANYMMGRRILGTGWGPAQARHVRFFRRDAVALSEAVHSRITPRPGSRVLRASEHDGLVHHFNYVTWEQFLDKLNRYTTVEAADLRESGRSVPSRRLVKELLGETYYRGVRGRAWRDGWQGICLVVLMLGYRTATYAKARLAETVGDEAAVVAQYRRIADDVLRARS